VSQIVQRHLFEVNSAKTRVRTQRTRQEVTGVVINGWPIVHPSFVRQVRAMLNAWKKYKRDAAEAEFWAKYDVKQRQKQKPQSERVVRGKIEYIGFIRGRDDALYLELLERYFQLNPSAAAANGRVVLASNMEQYRSCYLATGRSFWPVSGDRFCSGWSWFSYGGTHPGTPAHQSYTTQVRFWEVVPRLHFEEGRPS
jgi:hypothetical protein